MFNAYYNFLLEFSYWPIFSQQVYSFIVGMYFLDIFIAMGLESMLCESLLIAPIDVCINVIENTMTMGAASFVDFMVSFMVGLSITMIDRLYLGPAVDTREERQGSFNLGSLVVREKCCSLHAVEGIPRRSCPSLGRRQRDRSHSARSEDSVEGRSQTPSSQK